MKEAGPFLIVLVNDFIWPSDYRVWKGKARANTREDCLDVLGLPLKSIIVGRRKGLVVAEKRLTGWYSRTCKKYARGEGQYFLGLNSARLSPSRHLVSTRGYYTFLLRDAYLNMVASKGNIIRKCHPERTARHKFTSDLIDLIIKSPECISFATDISVYR